MIAIVASDATVGDGDAMGVAPEIGEYSGGPTERLLGVDDPSGAAHMGGEGMEARRLSEVYEVVEEPQGAGVEGLLQAFEEKGGGRVLRAA